MADPNSLSPPPPQVLPSEGNNRIAYHRTEGRSPGVVFLGGFMSDMTGTKAMALEAHCRAAGRAFLRFDYFGHGQSTGAFTDGSIGRWAEDALLAIDRLTEGPLILVGSSMGGWIMLLTALARRKRVLGLIGVASAPDFTEDLIWNAFDDAMRAAIQSGDTVEVPGDEGDQPYPITPRLIEDGRTHLLLRGPIGITCPVTLLHGMRDRDVPFETSIRLAEQLESSEVTVTLVKDGDHRMSEPPQIALLLTALDAMLARVGAGS